MLTRDQFFAVPPPLDTEDVTLPELGFSVKVRGMTGRGRDRWQIACAKGETTNISALVAVLCVVDDAGKPLFAEADVARLGEYPATVLNRIAGAALRLSRIGTAEVDELKKTSSTTPSDAS